MEDFPDASAYFQRLKSLSDQLKNVEASVDNNRLVLQLVSGLTKLYFGVATLIRQSNPLPQFYQARSMLTLEEAGLAKRAATTSASAMVANSRDADSEGLGNGRGKHKNQKNKGGRGKQNSGGGRGSGSGQSSGGSGSGWARPQGLKHQPGLLGPCPHQAYAASQQSYAPTDIEGALHTMTLQQPDPSWYMDTGATSHMTSTNGNLSSYFNLSNHHNNIVVGSGHTIPIRGCGSTTLPSPNPPLSLSKVLHAPKLIKNLISVRKFITDNCVYVEFVPYGFSVKDYRTEMPIMRCDSQGDLYPLTTTLSSTSPSTFTTLASSIWHDRLGHP
ncbi:uncharacterized protein LOC110691714 [Chenopodium quinoa]|uniref:uncharacterized protein LOC110691714 n=1 Tax=Chenopodium quinoa TaxID=63459 RepID=UPI000B774621|nr:uncharacterized protein LOC110691714 [Chenopodium quinoa]